MSLNVQKTRHETDSGPVAVLICVGRLTKGEGASTLQNWIRHCVNTRERKVVLNLDGVQYIDSVGIGELVSALANLQNQGAKLRLLSPTKQIVDLLQITKLYSVFKWFDDEDKAIHTSWPNTY